MHVLVCLSERHQKLPMITTTTTTTATDELCSWKRVWLHKGRFQPHAQVTEFQSKREKGTNEKWARVQELSW